MKAMNNRNKSTVKLCLEVLEDRMCPSGGMVDPPDLGSSTAPGGILQPGTWKPPNLSQNDNYSTPGNWVDNTVPGAAGGPTTAYFNAQASNAPCVVDVNPSATQNVTFNLSNGYSGGPTGFDLTASQITISLQDTDILNDFFTAKMDGCNTLTFTGSTVFGNVNITAPQYFQGSVVFPASSNAVIGWEPNLFDSIDPNVDVVGTLTVGNAYSDGLQKCYFGGNITVGGQTQANFQVLGDTNNANTPFSMVAGTTIIVGGNGTDGQVYLSDSSTNQQTLAGASFVCYPLGTLMVASGSWNITGADGSNDSISVYGGTLSLYSNTLVQANNEVFEGNSVGVTNSEILIYGNCTLNIQAQDGLTLLAGELNFTGLYQLNTTNVFLEGAQLFAQISGASSGSNHSNLNASGTITIDGSPIFVNGNGPISSGSTFTLMTAAGGITGDFSSFNTNVSGLQEKVQQSPYTNWICFMP